MRCCKEKRSACLAIHAAILELLLSGTAPQNRFCQLQTARVMLLLWPLQGWFRRQYLKLLLFFSSLPSPEASAILLFCWPRQRPVGQFCYCFANSTRAVLPDPATPPAPLFLTGPRFSAPCEVRKQPPLTLFPAPDFCKTLDTRRAVSDAPLPSPALSSRACRVPKLLEVPRPALVLNPIIKRQYFADSSATMPPGPGSLSTLRAGPSSACLLMQPANKRSRRHTGLIACGKLGSRLGALGRGYYAPHTFLLGAF